MKWNNTKTTVSFSFVVVNYYSNVYHYLSESTGSSSKKKPGQEKVKTERDENNMMPSIFAACHPISNVEDINEVLKEPPRWAERVEPLVPRAPTVVQNYLKDCHVDYDNYLTRMRLDTRMVPKTLICHDYKGGYQADKYLSS